MWPDSQFPLDKIASAACTEYCFHYKLGCMFSVFGRTDERMQWELYGTVQNLVERKKTQKCNNYQATRKELRGSGTTCFQHEVSRPNESEMTAVLTMYDCVNSHAHEFKVLRIYTVKCIQVL